MRIHTDRLTAQDLYANAPAGVYPETTRHGSRKRDHAFNVGMSAEEGSDAHGLKRVYARNTGRYGADEIEYNRAATYIEWGDWMVALFKIDPAAIIGPYDGAGDFVKQTTEWAPHRPKRENAVKHAARWARELAAAEKIRGRLESIRTELRLERISYGELAELEELRDSIEAGDLELLEAAGVPEELAHLSGEERARHE